MWLVLDISEAEFVGSALCYLDTFFFNFVTADDTFVFYHMNIYTFARVI